MKYIDKAQFAENLDSILACAAKYNEATGIKTADGNVVLISEEEYDALMETVFILRTEESREALKGAAAESIEEAIAEEDVSWD